MPDIPRVVVRKEDIKAGCIDALNQQGYTPERAQYLDQIPEIYRVAKAFSIFVPLLEAIAEFLTTDTYPKEVVLVDTTQMTGIVTKIHHVEGWIDLSQLGTNETIVLRYEVKMSDTGDFITYAEETFTGPVVPPLVYVHLRPSKYGVRLVARMESAPSADRKFPFQFFLRKVIEELT